MNEMLGYFLIKFFDRFGLVFLLLFCFGEEDYIS